MVIGEEIVFIVICICLCIAITTYTIQHEKTQRAKIITDRLESIIAKIIAYYK